MEFSFVTRNFQNVERNLHCDVLHITTVRVVRLVLDCIGVFAIKAYTSCMSEHYSDVTATLCDVMSTVSTAWYTCQHIIMTSQWTGVCHGINITHKDRRILRKMGRLSANRVLYHF